MFRSVLAPSAAIILCAVAHSAAAAGDAVEGTRIVTRECRVCHLSAPAPQFDGAPPEFEKLVSAHKLSKDEFIGLLTKRGHYPMPPRGLTVADVDHIVAYFDSIGYWR